jgi:hypothetical protein
MEVLRKIFGSWYFWCVDSCVVTVMQNKTQVYPGSGHHVGVIPYILLCFVIAVSNNVLQARLP